MIKYENDIVNYSQINGEFHMNNTKIDIMISGDNVSEIRKTINFELSSKDEDIFYISSEDGWKELDIKRLFGYRNMMVYSIASNVPFDIRITMDLLRLAASGFDNASENGLYEQTGTVNGRPLYTISSSGSYIQWSSSNSRWEQYNSSSVLLAYTNNVSSPELGTWLHANASPYTTVKIVKFSADPITLQCRDVFMFGPYNDAFVSTISKIELQTSSSTQVQIGILSMGAI